MSAQRLRCWALATGVILLGAPLSTAHPSAAVAAAAVAAAAGTVIFHTPTHGDVLVKVELATTEAELARGLMFRHTLAANRGMLFTFPSTSQRAFWMKNTFISLDMIFLSDGLQVLGVVPRTRPLSLVPRGVSQPSRYVVEVNADFAATHGIVVGTQAALKDLPGNAVPLPP